ncbi:hypothetical protein CBR_g34314 [Chara braunii]|uniref:2Fe-2S ferredoxin-type domain-containing protein n=1 Tax=Chara braunii TaxID=69332 RepID=A0A388JZ10_CHABU|nr:hypothetical protein CBR_g34314 [Chara braunii]|eukprot:GBG62943.1 hypothetical protein CBR_g34314 [Chara braunii]
MLANHLRRTYVKSAKQLSRVLIGVNHSHHLHEVRRGGGPVAAARASSHDSFCRNIHVGNDHGREICQEVTRGSRVKQTIAPWDHQSRNQNEEYTRSAQQASSSVVWTRGRLAVTAGRSGFGLCRVGFHSQPGPSSPTLAPSAAAVADETSAADIGVGDRPPRVSEKMLELTVVDLEGRRQSYRAREREGLTVLGALKDCGVETGCHCKLHDRGLEVCMGNCHVEIADEWLAKFPPRSKDELNVLVDHAPGQITRHSRLSCLLPLTKEHDGIVLSVTEEIPWDIP